MQYRRGAGREGNGRQSTEIQGRDASPGARASCPQGSCLAGWKPALPGRGRKATSETGRCVIKKGAWEKFPTRLPVTVNEWIVSTRLGRRGAGREGNGRQSVDVQGRDAFPGAWAFCAQGSCLAGWKPALPAAVFRFLALRQGRIGPAKLGRRGAGREGNGRQSVDVQDRDAFPGAWAFCPQGSCLAGWKPALPAAVSRFLALRQGRIGPAKLGRRGAGREGNGRQSVGMQDRDASPGARASCPQGSYLAGWKPALPGQTDRRVIKKRRVGEIPHTPFCYGNEWTTNAWRRRRRRDAIHPQSEC